MEATAAVEQLAPPNVTPNVNPKEVEGGVLGLVLDIMPDIFHREILPLLDPTDRAMFGRALGTCREALGPHWNDTPLQVKVGRCRVDPEFSQLTPCLLS